MATSLRRSIQGSVRYSAIASQFTQSEAKGRTLHLPVLYSAGVRQLTQIKVKGKTCREQSEAFNYSTIGISVKYKPD
jgi:hypothetical protein